MHNDKQQYYKTPDPEWKFIAFLRNPAERLLSAYLDKVYSKKTEREHFQKQHGLNRTLSFNEFLDVLAEEPLPCPSRLGNDLDRLKGVNWCTNPHWRPQTYSCGLSEVCVFQIGNDFYSWHLTKSQPLLHHKYSSYHDFLLLDHSIIFTPKPKPSSTK